MMYVREFYPNDFRRYPGIVHVPVGRPLLGCLFIVKDEGYQRCHLIADGQGIHVVVFNNANVAVEFWSLASTDWVAKVALAQAILRLAKCHSFCDEALEAMGFILESQPDDNLPGDRYGRRARTLTLGEHVTVTYRPLSHPDIGSVTVSGEVQRGASHRHDYRIVRWPGATNPEYHAFDDEEIYEVARPT